MDSDITGFAMVMVVIIASTFSFVVMGLGARWIWMRGSGAQPSSAPPHDDARMQRLETAVDTIAIEVERISESQRFLVSLLAESLPALRTAAAKELAPPPPSTSGRVNTPH